VVHVSATGSNTFSRYTSLTTASTQGTKASSLSHLPKQLAAEPLGVGLGTVGAAAGFGGTVTNLLEGHNVSAETQYNFVSDELGILGLALWVSLTVTVIVTVVSRLRRVADVELRLDLAAVFASFIAFAIMGTSGPTMASPSFGPFFWFATGIAAYWLVGRRGRFRAALPVGEP
jgi:hypothetical protein